MPRALISTDRAAAFCDDCASDLETLEERRAVEGLRCDRCFSLLDDVAEIVEEIEGLAVEGAEELNVPPRALISVIEDRLAKREGGA